MKITMIIPTTWEHFSELLPDYLNELPADVPIDPADTDMLSLITNAGLQDHDNRILLTEPDEPLFGQRQYPRTLTMKAMGVSWASTGYVKGPLGEAIWLSWAQLNDQSMRFEIESQYVTLDHWVKALAAAVRRDFQVKIPKAPNYEPSPKVQQRAKLYQGIKDEHSEYSPARIANVANSLPDSTKDHSEDSVRNAYRAMRRWTKNDCWKWEKASRVR